MDVRRTIDLSVPVDEHTVVYPGDPAPRLEPYCTVAEDGFNVLQLHLGSQTGTHVDAPYHFVDSAPRIDELDLALFTGRGVVVDVRGVGARESIGWDRIEPYAAGIGPGTIVLLCTGWSQHYGTERYFDHPYLDAAAAERLLALGVRTVGLDAINIDETPGPGAPGVGYPVHHQIAAVGGVIAENLRNLEAIDFADPFISLLPIALAGADGAPVRAVALDLRAGPATAPADDR